MRPMPPLRNLRILALSRNKIRRINGLDEIGDTLEELWLSYNQIDTLNGLHPCRALKILYLSNNKIRRMEELDKLRDNPKLINVLFMGNPIYEGKQSVQYGRDDINLCEAQLDVLKRLTNLEVIDGKTVTLDDRSKLGLGGGD